MRVELSEQKELKKSCVRGSNHPSRVMSRDDVTVNGYLRVVSQGDFFACALVANRLEYHTSFFACEIKD